MSKVNTQELSALIQELQTLSSKPRLTPSEERRNAFLLAAISAVKAGATLAEIEAEGDAARRSKAGLPPVSRVLNLEQLREARGWKEAIERRDMGEGAPMLNHIGTYNNLGYFVPTGFFPQMFSAMAAHDVLFDEDACTVIKSSNGQPTTVPTIGDIENIAAVLGEGGSLSAADLYSTGQAVLGAYKYAAYDVVSREAFEDLDSTLSAVEIFKRNFTDRFARGIGRDLVNGNGSSKPLGLIPSLLAAGVPTVAASGSAVNTGGSETGTTSIGSADFASALADLDDAYANSPKCAWLMNKKTLANVAGIVTKYGQPLDLVKNVDGQPFILGIPVKICPSMDNIGNGKNPVVLGDLSYWATRLVADPLSGIQVINEAPGLVENGKMGLACFFRADGELLYNDTGSPAPFVMIQNHS